jgi:hypothetical protein
MNIPRFLFGQAQPGPHTGPFWLIHSEAPRFLASVDSESGDEVRLLFRIVQEIDNLDSLGGDDYITALIHEAALFVRRHMDYSLAAVRWQRGLALAIPAWLVVSSSKHGFFGVMRTAYPSAIVQLDNKSPIFAPLQLTCTHPLTKEAGEALVTQAHAFLQLFGKYDRERFNGGDGAGADGAGRKGRDDEDDKHGDAMERCPT